MANVTKKFELKPCPRCAFSKPHLYAEGNAQKVIYEDGSGELFFTGNVGYICECFECGTRTDEYVLEKEAIEAWNNHEFQDSDKKVFYD